MKLNVKYICLIPLLWVNALQAQIGGLTNFEFLRQAPSARATALGGTAISIADGDIALAWQNPGIADDSIFHKQAAVNHNFHFSGISNGLLSYGHRLEKQKISLIGGVQYINYGDFSLTDVIGNIQGTFTGREVAVGIGASKQINERIRAGALLKFANSTFESFSANAILADFGIYYQKPGSSKTIGIVLKNTGFQLSRFANESRGVPFDLQVAYSNRLEHLPFRFTIVGQRLDRWNILFDDPDQQGQVDILGNSTDRSDFEKGVDNFLRHFIFNGEFLLGKNETFRLRFGYNHLLRQELRLSTFGSSGGFSFGFGFKIKKFSIDYGRGNFHLAGGVNHVGISYDLGNYKKKF